MPLAFVGKKPAQSQVQEAPPATAKGSFEVPESAALNTVLVADVSQKVNKYLELAAKIAPLAPALKEAEVLKKELSAYATDNFPANVEAHLKGEDGVVIFTAATEGSELVDMHGLIGALKAKLGAGDAQAGYQKLLLLLKINKGDVEKVLSASEMEAFYKKAEGPRKFKAAVANT